MEWSCCLAEDADARGCIEEHSVGIKSTLGQIKNSFKNYVPIKPQQAWKEATCNNSQLLNSNSKLDLVTYKKSSVERIRSACSSTHQHQHSHSHNHNPNQHSLHGHTNHSYHDNHGNKLHDTPSNSQNNSTANSKSQSNPNSMQSKSHHGQHHNHHQQSSQSHHHSSNNQETHGKQVDKLSSRRLTYQPSATSVFDNEAIMFQTSLFNTSSRDLIGKVRQGTSRNLSGNRPMTSPAGFRLYQHS